MYFLGESHANRYLFPKKETTAVIPRCSSAQAWKINGTMSRSRVSGCFIVSSWWRRIDVRPRRGIFTFVTVLGWTASFRQAEDKSRYLKNTPYLYRCLRAKQLLRASELMRAAYHEKEVQFNPIKDNQRPTATRDEYLLLLWWLNGSTEGVRLQVFFRLGRWKTRPARSNNSYFANL